MVLVVDIDGTVADTQPRIRDICERHHVTVDEWGEKHVNDFLAPGMIAKDVPFPKAKVLTRMMAVGTADVVFLTGRSERGRAETVAWLSQHLGMPKDIPLFMREDDDKRPTVACKMDIFKRKVIPRYRGRLFVFLDDDEELLKRYAEKGVALLAPDCWQTLVSPRGSKAP